MAFPQSLTDSLKARLYASWHKRLWTQSLHCCDDYFWALHWRVKHITEYKYLKEEINELATCIFIFEFQKQVGTCSTRFFVLFMAFRNEWKKEKKLSLKYFYFLSIY